MKILFTETFSQPYVIPIFKKTIISFKFGLTKLINCITDKLSEKK